MSTTGVAPAAMRPSDVYPDLTRQEVMDFLDVYGMKVVGFRMCKDNEPYVATNTENRTTPSVSGKQMRIYTASMYIPAAPRLIVAAKKGGENDG